MILKKYLTHYLLNVSYLVLSMYLDLINKYLYIQEIKILVKPLDIEKLTNA